MNQFNFFFKGLIFNVNDLNMLECRIDLSSHDIQAMNDGGSGCISGRVTGVLGFITRGAGIPGRQSSQRIKGSRRDD